jgi:hypothetical protein
VAEGKGKRRSLHEAFGQEAPRSAAEAKSAREPLEANGRTEQTPTPESRTTRRPASGGTGRQGERSRTRKASKSQNTTAKDAGKGKAAAITAQHEAKMVPGKNGEMVPAQKPVNMTFTVTANERYLWTLELKRRGLTAVSVLRKTMQEMMGEANR